MVTGLQKQQEVRKKAKKDFSLIKERGVDMKLLTKEIEKKLLKNPYGSHDGEGYDAKVIVKFFNPCGAGTWLITEGEKLTNGDWELYGYCHIHEWEWGSVLLSSLEKYRDPRFGLGIERDRYAGKTIKDNLCDELTSSYKGYIIEVSRKGYSIYGRDESFATWQEIKSFIDKEEE